MWYIGKNYIESVKKIPVNLRVFFMGKIAPKPQ